jgi:hypothetical protein
MDGAVGEDVGMRTSRPGAVGLCVLAAIALVAAACTSKKASPSGSAQALAWQAGKAEAANGTPPPLSAEAACGSATETYLAELLHTSPTQTKVAREWGDIVAGGKQVSVSGTVATTHLGPTDLPMSHPFGDDLSMDIGLDPAFLGFARSLGPAESPPGTMHVEISSGLEPHGPVPNVDRSTQTWRDASDVDLSGFQPGFDKPAVGDRFLGMGRWIIDCGHENYQTELHPMAFLAWAETQSNTTVVRTYFNPYRDTETYSPDASILGHVDDAARLTAPGSQPFVPYLVNDVLRVIGGQADRLQSQELVEATHASPPPWSVCAPPDAPGSSGKKLDVRYDIVARPGVRVHITGHDDTGCATVETVLGKDYRPLDVQLRACALPWPYLNQVARDALDTTIDVQGLIAGVVPAAVRAPLDRDPTTSCADPLVGPDLAPSPSGQRLRVDATQPFPFYGVITVARAGS